MECTRKERWLRTWLVGVGVAVVGVALVAACSGAGGGAPATCSPREAACGAGDVCWALDDRGTFGCVPAFDAGFGSQCQNAFGVASCGTDLTCDQVSAAQGTCTSYCSSSQACPPGFDCYDVMAGSGRTALTICRAAPDAGTVPTTQDDGGVEIPTPDAAAYRDAAADARELPI